ncbi:PQQ-like beta-propeller repeat protein [Archangium violaceum]|uniref:PQQ-binding-like beta-propeller repeat protein n=1 Tax=Archangium violaceum TaxID=83451 RepID=UPI00193C557E|nr:PQQ-binding-like beta-propeller repeat protein [Archangium violaceum]QRK13285.1 PQQ-like beta-propeller repeat protein [Archangium violaceum]
MRLRRVFGALLVLGALGGCSEVPGKCEQDSNCPQEQYCHLEVKQCFSPRYAALILPTLGENTVVGGGPQQIQARLELSPGASPVYPSQLNLTVAPSNGGAPTVITLQSTAEGTYSAEWTPPPGEGSYTFQVAHPEPWGPSRSVQVTVDRTAPALTVQVPEAQLAEPKDGFSYADPLADKAWPRDQTVTVRVESESADIDPAGLRVVVRGHDGGTDVTDLAVKQGTPCTKAYCGTVDVPLWRPGLEAFRGNFQVEVAAKDKVGNERQANGTIPVTRWKWAFDGASGPIHTSPAIGEKGTIYFGTDDAAGKVFALNPEGSIKWTAPLGPVKTNLTVGSSTNGTERVYVGRGPTSSTDFGYLYALDANGATLLQCKAYLAGVPLLSTLTLLRTQASDDAAPVEAVMAMFSSPDDNTPVTLRPDSSNPSRRCIFGTAGHVAPGAGIVSTGDDLYFGSFYLSDPYPDIAEINHYINDPYGSFVSLPRASPTNRDGHLAALAIVDDTFGIGALWDDDPQIGGVITFTRQDSTLGSWIFPNPEKGRAPVRNLAVGPGKVVFFGRDVATGSAELTSVEFFGSMPRVVVPNAGSFPSSPIVGASGLLYTASATGPSASSGEVSAWSTDNLALHWRLSDSVGRAQATPALDCARGPDGAPTEAPKGVLYVPSIDGKMYALVVDSAGLERNAPWPKFQRDARNTGNTETPITNCR